MTLKKIAIISDYYLKLLTICMVLKIFYLNNRKIVQEILLFIQFSTKYTY